MDAIENQGEKQLDAIEKQKENKLKTVEKDKIVYLKDEIDELFKSKTLLIKLAENESNINYKQLQFVRQNFIA